jgi:hypothetical protein
LIGAGLRFQLTVTDSRSLTASDNVDITVKWVGFADDFSTDTTGTYTVTATDGAGGTFTWDSVGKRAQVLTGNDNILKVSHTILATDNGVFSLDFRPITPYIDYGGVWIRLRQDPNTYYEIKNFDNSVFGLPRSPGDDPSVNKVVNNIVVNTLPIPSIYTQGTTYNLKITFSSTQVVVEGFGPPVTLNTNNTTAISPTSFEVETGQQDAYYDNFKLLAQP